MHGEHTGKPHSVGVGGMTQGQGPEEVKKVEGRMEVDTPSQTNMGHGDY